MKQAIHIAGANIHGLNDKVKYIAEKKFYAWSLTFTKPTATFLNLAHIYLDDVYYLAEQAKEEFKKHFTEANILDGNRVAVLFTSSGDILAIGSSGSPYWIDVNDKFKAKRLKELNLNLDSLIYHL